MQMQILDCDYTLLNGRPLIRLYGKTIEGKPVCVFYDKFLPYFYVVGDEYKFKTIEQEIKKSFDIRTEIVEKFTPIGYQEKPRKVLKIIGKDPSKVPEMKEIANLYGTSYEADVLFKYRFMADLGLKGMCWVEAEGKAEHTDTVRCQAFHADKLTPIEKPENVKLKYMAFDIECISETEGIPEASRDPIILISIAFEPEYRGKKDIVLMAKPFRSDGVEGCANEKEMIERFKDILFDFDPDIILGYNLNSFDIPYILGRMEKLGIKNDMGRVKKRLFTKKLMFGYSTNIYGRIVVDPYEIIKKDPWLHFKRYNLATVAKEMLGMEKLDVGGMKGMLKLWKGTKEDLQKFIDYSRRDSVLALNLVREKGLIDQFFELAKVSGLLLQDTFGGQSQRHECKLLHEFRDKNIIMPCKPDAIEKNKRKSDREKEGLKGAIVLDPIPGLYSGGCVLVLDFASLYPSIVKTFNICPSTLLLNDENIEHVVSPYGSKFVKPNIKQGILPRMITEMVESRREVKKQLKIETDPNRKRMLNAKQLALKTMANSVHPETHIVVKNPSNEIKIIEIEKLFNRFSAEKKIKKTGHIDVIELNGWKTLSVDSDKACFKPLYAISRHKNKEKLIKIRTKMGEVKVTKDHSIIKMLGKSDNRIRNSRFEGLKEVGGKDVNYNTIIAQVNDFKIKTKEQKHLNLAEFLSNLPEEETKDIYLFVPKKLNIKKNNWYKNRKIIFNYLKRNGATNSRKLEKELSFERRIFRKTENTGLKKIGLTTVGNCGMVPVYDISEEGLRYLDFFNVFEKAREAANHHEIPIKEFKNIKIPAKILNNSKIAVGGRMGAGRRKINTLIPITKELAELFGWFVAEGSTTKIIRGEQTYYKANIVNYNKNTIKRLNHIIKNIFSYNPGVYNTQISLNLKVFYLLFRYLAGAGSKEKRIPDFILNNTKEIRDAFLDAYTKGDGDKDGRRFTTLSRELAAQLSFLLKEEDCILHNGKDSGIFRISRRDFSHGKKIVSGDLFGQEPVEIKEVEGSKYVYDLSVMETEKFVTAEGLVLHNSLYGYTGFVHSRLYVMDIANSITAYGRENIMKTKKLVEEKYPVKVIYGDSITSDRFVTIMDENGFVKIKNIEELFKENKDRLTKKEEKYTKKYLQDGIAAVILKKENGKEIINNTEYRALTINPKTFKTEWKKIKKIIRHKTNKKIFRVNQKFGESITTEDHSFMTINSGELRETKPNEMKGSKMIKIESIPKLKQIKEIDFYEILKKYFFDVKYKGRKKTNKVSTDEKYVWFGWTKRKNPVKLKRKIKVDSKEFESLCRLMGAYIAEGSSSTPETTKSRLGANISCDDIEWLQQLQGDYFNLFENVKAGIIKSSTKDNTYKLQFMNNLSAVFFKILCGQKSEGKKIPEFIFHVPKKYQLIVLENMIKGDGSRKFMNKRLNYSEKYKKNNFRYETKSLGLASGLTFLLCLLKQKHTLRYRREKGTYIITTCSKYNSRLPTKISKEEYKGYVYDLEVEGTHTFVDSCGQILLHNTDSIFVKTDIADMERAENLGKEISAYATGFLNGLLLEFEKIYKSFLILAKKRYAALSMKKEGDVWKGKMEMKGIETVRRDWCELTTNTMLEVLNIILKEGNIKKGAKYVKSVLDDLANGKIPLEDLTIVKGVSKSVESYGGINKAGGRISPPAHVELAKKMLDRDPNLGSMVGQRIGYVIIKGNAMLTKRAEDPDFVKANGLEIDPRYYMENQMLPPVERIFEVCGVTRAELIEGTKQRNLFEMIRGKVSLPDQTTLKGFDSVICNKCRWSARRPPLRGACENCGASLYFIHNGNMGKFVEVS